MGVLQFYFIGLHDRTYYTVLCAAERIWAALLNLLMFRAAAIFLRRRSHVHTRSIGKANCAGQANVRSSI